jgi:hypothetical protein
MKQNMMIIGAVVVQGSNPGGSRNGIVELTLVPLTTVKTKTPGLMDMMKGGLNMESLMNQAQGLVQHKTKMYVSIGEYLDNYAQPFKHITLELLPDD